MRLPLASKAASRFFLLTYCLPFFPFGAVDVSTWGLVFDYLVTAWFF